MTIFASFENHTNSPISLQKKQVTMSDHHSMSEQFCEYMKSESRLRGGCPADWVWIVPPISGKSLHLLVEVLN